MARTRRLVETKELKTRYLSRILGNKVKVRTFHRYDEDLDTVFILFVDPSRETVTHPVDDHAALLYDPETLEVVGVTIESFEKGFLRQQASKVWKLSKTGLVFEKGADLAFRFEAEKTIPGWDRKALEVKSRSPNYHEVDVLVPT